MIDLLKVKGYNPFDKTELYYLQFTRRTTHTTTQMAERMSRGSSSYTKGEVAGVTLDLPTAMLESLLDGAAICIDGLGTFKPRVYSQSDTDPAKVTRASLRSIDIQFSPDPKLVAELAARAEYRIVQRATAEGEQDATTEGGDQQPPADGQTPTPPPAQGGDDTSLDT